MSIQYSRPFELSRRSLLRGMASILTLPIVNATGIVTASSPKEEDRVLAFSYFVDNGQDGLHLLWSEDGLDWKPVCDGKSLLTPAVGSKLMRDPCVVPDSDGNFQMVWTTGWWDLGFGYAKTNDFREWSEQKFVPINEKVTGAKNTWAPELTWEEKTKTWWIAWATTIPGKFPETDKDGDHNHRIYATKTKDFMEFSEPELLFNPGYNCIDSTFVHLPERVVQIFKDERLGKKMLQVAIAQKMGGPYEKVLPPFTGDWVEGPTVVKVGEAWLLYCDHYADPQHYQVFRTEDFQKWENLTPHLKFPKGIRHGTAFHISRKVIEALNG